ncbi:MAG: hypothetical protein RR047_02185 [Bacilli bacterium]
MFDPVQRVLDGNLYFLDRLTNSDKNFILEKLLSTKQNVPRFKELFVELLPYFGKGLIFKHIYLKDELLDCVFFLLNDQDFKSTQLDLKTITDLMKNTNWGVKFVLKNYEILRKQHDSLGVEVACEMERLILKDKNKEEEIKQTIDFFLYNKNKSERAIFFTRLLKTHNSNLLELMPSIDSIITDNPLSASYHQTSMFENDVHQEYISSSKLNMILSALCQGDFKQEEIEKVIKLILEDKEKTNLAFVLGNNLDKPNIRSLVKKNLKEIIEKSNLGISTIMEELKDDIKDNPDFANYQEYLHILSMTNNLSKKRVIDNLVIYGDIQTFNSFIEHYKAISHSNNYAYVSAGTTSTVYHLGDYCLKLASNKYTPDCPSNHFRILKRLDSLEVKGNNNDKLYVEIYPFLSNKDFTDEAIYQLFKDLDKDGLELTDPLCLKFDHCNFAVLNDYHDANCDNKEDLPEWFKACPLVLIDVDLIYKKSDVKKKRFIENYVGPNPKMRDVIKIYEKAAY